MILKIFMLKKNQLHSNVTAFLCEVSGVDLPNGKVDVKTGIKDGKAYDGWYSKLFT